MRVTVGGVLLFAGIGMVAALGPMKTLVDPTLVEQIGPVKDAIAWVQNYFKGSQPAETAPITVPSQSEPSQPSSSEPAKAVEPSQQPAAAAPVAVTAPASVAPATPPSVVEPVAVPKPVKARRHRRPRKKAAAPAAAKAAPAAVASAPAKESSGNKSAGDLTGTYVALQLKTGREVKGILQGKANGKYTLMIPGMGPFDYEADKVAGIKPAE